MKAGSVRFLATVAAVVLASGSVEMRAEAAEPAAVSQLDGETLTLEFIDKAIAEGRYKSAHDLLARARIRFGGPEVSLREAELLLAAGSLAEAATAFQLLESDPAVGARAQAGRGITAIRAGHAEAAESLLADAVARDPSLARAWSARGVLADQRQDWAAADHHYAQALAAAPGSANILSNRGYSRLLRGLYAEAEADFNAALAKQPGLKVAATNLQLAKAMQGRYAEAFTGTSRDELARDLNTVGVAAMLRGDHRIAEGYFARAIDMNSRYDKVASDNLAYLKSIAPELKDDDRARP
ncbi:tetratricopeptide repeat protein [Sandaracinobacter neustonicus]|uniref:Tetratricopeptide repeat protein n=1 Tax=Sandaracinobacter neustonicus TaxID=1715348 RepID=A0A501XMM6_9SPHN|nr:tetratricopeptide repeat protein [Sandaracinobacter neustonicus]TPE61816.1 tetratricopeptide repeat protein [Sandaracinobacter neustonicus]